MGENNARGVTMVGHNLKHFLFNITSANINRFQYFFHFCTQGRAAEECEVTPPPLKSVAALPCEIWPTLHHADIPPSQYKRVSE